MLELTSLINGKSFAQCSFCMYEFLMDDVTRGDWFFCPRCGRELWKNGYRPWQ